MARFHTFTEGVEVIVIPDGEPYQRADEPGGNARWTNWSATNSSACASRHRRFARMRCSCGAPPLDINGRVPKP